MSKNTKNRLLENRIIDPVTNCWLWTGAKSLGYGQLLVEGKIQRVHRLSYEIFVGPLTQLALHRCSNKHCFNPDHLYDGSYSDNLGDRINKDGFGPANGHSLKTHCPKGHPYSGRNLVILKRSNKRECRICRNVLSKEAMRRRRAK